MDLACCGSNQHSVPDLTTLTSDVYFLIQKFLSNGPLRRTLQTLNEELHEFKLLPKRIDWQGNEHERTIEDMQKQFTHIHPDFLFYLCSQASASLNSTSSLIPSILSFRSKCKNSEEVYTNFRQYLNFTSRFCGNSLSDGKTPFNIVNSIRGRDVVPLRPRRKTIHPRLYCGMQMQRCTIGHLSAVYCLLFDHSGRYVITGADDLLIKLWSIYTGRLIAVFRGASLEITDIAIDSENCLLAAGSIDRILRVWNLQTGAPIAVLTGHTGMITSVNFCPTSCWNYKYIITTSTDGTVAFWPYNSEGFGNKVEFRPPNLYQEKIRPGQAQMICSSFSPGGTFLATGSADHHVRIYYMKGDEGPQRILQTEAHTDRVDSIQWAHSGLRFLSGSKDGSAIIWWFERQQWKNIYLDMRTKLADDKQNVESDSKKIRVTMVTWDRSDQFVVTAVSDHSLKVWKASNGELVRVLIGHNDEVYVLESHPHDNDVILSAGHDGQLFIWDIHHGEKLFSYLNTIEGQGYGAIFDAKWSPDGCTISASDSHGDILTFGLGSGSPFYKELPKELFFHTDYRPLVRDQNFWVLDEQTQVPPHLMPPPFLVDIDGNPYPPVFQRLVPGRENCNVEQLVPNIVIGNEGIQEVIQDVSPRVVEALEEHGDHEDLRMNNAAGSLRIQRIRQSTGDWQTDHNIEWKKSVLIKPLEHSVYERANEIRKLIEEAEMKEYQKQLRTRPLMISTAGPSNAKVQKKRPTKRQIKTKAPKEVELDHYDVIPLSDYLSDESSFSDWAEELSEARKRRAKRRRNNAQNVSKSSSDNDDDDMTEDTGQSDDDDSEETSDEEKREERKARSSRENSRIKKSGRHANSALSKNNKEGRTSKLPSNQPSGSAVPSTSKTPKIKVSEQYKLSEWLSETRPRKSPYYPQIHDEIVYFVQGHILYIEAVKQKNVYEPNIRELPWVKRMQLKDHEFCKVVGIRYEIKPPRLCCLKLALQDDNGRPTGKTFNVRFHDMPDVLDFLVLKQCYLTALSREWNTGDRFRCLIDDNWWIGEINGKSPSTDLYPDSAFMCYEISWTNGEQERMSPWDMEPIDEARIPEDEKEAIPVLANELRSVLYKPTPEDWPNCERDTACKAIARGLTQVMELAIAEPFLVPVDINVYPTYAMIVEYPIDLSTIKARVENNFYRRLAAAQFDIHYLSTNAAKFNEQHSSIVKHAKILTELCLKIVKSGNNAIDIASIYHQLVDDYSSSTSGDEAHVDITQPSTSRGVRYNSVRSWKSPDDWKIEASGLVELMLQTEDSVPFREPVNRNRYPTYHQVVKDPMDLGTVKDKLQKGFYREPKDFCSDIRLIFQNSRTFNTNKRSRIYVMTVRLSAMFEEHIKKITSNWRIARKRQRRLTSSSDRTDNITGSSDENLMSQKQQTVKVVVEKIENCDDNAGGGSSDSDNNPLGYLRNKNLPTSSAESEESAAFALRKVTQNGISEPSVSGYSLNGMEPSLNHVNTLPSTSVQGINEKSQHSLNSTSDDEDDDDEYHPPKRILDSESEDESSGKERKQTNKANSSSENEDSKTLMRVRAEMKRKKAISDGDDDNDEDFCPEDSSGSSNRLKNNSSSSNSSDSDNSQRNKKRRKRAQSFVVEDEEEASSTSSQSDSNTSDSDLPLRKSRRGKRRQPKNNHYNTSSDDSDAVGSRPRRKKRKAGHNLDYRRANGRSSSFGNVSSRGRIRKITERAAAFLKKDKKSA
ncbi:hypothetical protein ABEB36_004677 [Hypothenemus hampei]|uniref:Bromo domain-containing protein n=1 Tax=Hypothenemus hampei TaxID=57062 RepID=A0ABD1F4F0_HYPHA